MKKSVLMLLLLNLLIPSLAIAGASPEYQLAVLNAQERVPEDHVTVYRFKELLEIINKRTGTSKDRIGDMTLFVHNKLKDKGKNYSLLFIMEQAAIAVEGIQEPIDYAQVITLLSVLLEQSND